MSTIPSINKRIFILDDEPDQAKMAGDLLVAEGYHVSTSADPEKGIQIIESDPPNLILLDIRMPKKDGLDVCKDLKTNPKTRHIPIIFLSTKSSETDVVLGLELGAEDYIRKPFLDRELLARVKTVLRRKDTEPAPEVLRKGPLEVNFATYTAKLNGKSLSLRRREFELLGFFFRREGLILTRSVLSEGVWGKEFFPTARTVDFHIKELRKALGPHRDWIKSIRGIGYRFEIECSNP